MEKNKPIKDGKTSISTKNKGKGYSNLTHDDIYGNKLEIPEYALKDAKERGLEFRFISAKELYANQGYHKSRWEVYKSNSDIIKGPKEWTLKGEDPDGVIRRGDLILAFKTEEDAKKQRAFLRQKARRYSQHISQNAQDLKNMSREGRVNSVITEGYDDD